LRKHFSHNTKAQKLHLSLSLFISLLELRNNWLQKDLLHPANSKDIHCKNLRSGNKWDTHNILWKWTFGKKVKEDSAGNKTLLIPFYMEGQYYLFTTHDLVGSRIS
jgi:hypothetical protein